MLYLMVIFLNFILSLCYKKYKYVFNGWQINICIDIYIYCILICMIVELLEYLKMLYVYIFSKEIGYNMIRCIYFKWIFIDLFYYLFFEILYFY